MRSQVLLVEDHTLVRSGIRSLLESARDIEIVGEAGDGREAIEMVRRLHPRVVLMDIAMGDLNGIDATRQIVTEHPNVRVLILSMHNDGQYIFEAMKAGAKGYVLKSAAVKELIVGTSKHIDTTSWKNSISDRLPASPVSRSSTICRLCTKLSLLRKHV